jgi:PPOX class probable F420-dependent enzyme
VAIPRELQGKKYISLASFRKNGAAVYTPLWYAEQDGNLYVQTRNDSGKYERIRNNPAVRVAPCTASGKIRGPEFSGRARILPADQWKAAREAVRRKYWLARLPFWSKKNEFLEIVLTA